MKASTGLVLLGAAALALATSRRSTPNEDALDQAADTQTDAEAPYIGIAQNVGDVNGDGLVNAEDMFLVLGYVPPTGFNSRDYVTPQSEQQAFSQLSEATQALVVSYHTVRNIPALERTRDNLLADINSSKAKAEASGNRTFLRMVQEKYDSYYAPRIDSINEAIAFLQKWGEYS